LYIIISFENCFIPKLFFIILEYDREKIAVAAEKKREENDAFRIFLKNKKYEIIDEWVQSINNEVEKKIDCTLCGACCKGLMINVTLEESQNVAKHLKMEEATFKKTYIEESQNGIMIMNTIPCHFLSDKKCSIYENRFNECREFPHLKKPNFTNRLFGTLIHYSICPIIYNVIEQLKIKSNFFLEN
jgi:Fe-S-cluster containining protein